MSCDVSIKHIEFTGHIGITDEERRRPQPVGVDLEVSYDARMFDLAATTDDIKNALDYAKIVARVVEIGTAGEYRLLERLADQIVSTLFADFPVRKACIWVRKLVPPLKEVRESVGVRMVRARDDVGQEPRPAPFLVEQLPRLPGNRALDVAAGRGRHTCFLATHGFAVEAIDRDAAALAEVAALAQSRGLSGITVRTVDLEEDPEEGAGSLPAGHYDVIIVFFYLYRPLFPTLIEALKPGGVLLYETFLIDNHFRYQHPTRTAFCLAHNELLRLADGLRIVHYDEGEHDGSHGSGRAFTARLLAEKGA